jgi:hypothetical protein
VRSTSAKVGTVPYKCGTGLNAREEKSRCPSSYRPLGKSMPTLHANVRHRTDVDLEWWHD